MTTSTTAALNPDTQRSAARMPFDSMFSRGIFRHLTTFMAVSGSASDQPMPANDSGDTAKAIPSSVEVDFSHNFNA